MVPRWKTESTAVHTRAALGIRPRLLHRAEMSLAYDELGAAAEEPVDAVVGFTTGLGLGLGLATALTPETPTCSGTNGAAPSGAETAGELGPGAAARTESR